MLTWGVPRSRSSKAVPPDRLAMNCAVPGTICIRPFARAGGRRGGCRARTRARAALTVPGRAPERSPDSTCHLVQHLRHLPLQIGQVAVVLHHEGRTTRLFPWGKLPPGARVDAGMASCSGALVAHRLIGDDSDGRVEARLHPGLEQQGDLDDRGARGAGAVRQLLAPGRDPLPDPRPQLTLEPATGVLVVE